MDLVIDVYGLCMFVTDPAHNRVHLLLPATMDTSGPGATIHKHFPVLEYRKRTLDTVVTSMERRVLDLTGLGGAGKSPLVWPPTVVDMAPLVNAVPIPASQLGDTPKHIVSRITLPLATEIQEGAAACWSFPLGTGLWINRMTPFVRYTVRQITFPGDLPRAYLNRQANDKDDVLPVGDDPSGTVHLTVTHVPDPAHPCPDLNIGDTAAHFQAYYGAFGDGVTGPSPTRIECGSLGGKVADAESGCEEPDPDISAFNCMAIRASA
jgi:hypothetical protein